jgi:hypothetical protein
MGRKTPHGLLETIPLAHWEVAQIDYLDYLRDKKGATDKTTLPGPIDRYRDIYFDATETSALWPDARVKKLAWRMPVEWK